MGRVCYGCFRPLKGDENICPYCGYHVHAILDSEHILKPGTVLNQKYTIGKTLGEGGFGITYLAWDNNMQTKIAIKEFFPANLVARDTNSESNTQIYTISKAYSDEFHTGMERFVKEAAVLSKFFKLQGIVSVKDFFYENGTAYIVMEYIEGITLKEYLKQKGGKLSVEETLTLMKPVMESLAIVHREKMLHRDISPDNLMISSDFQVKLIDFGSARYYDAQSDKSMTVILKHGYAPIEQYSSNGNQGTWTDVYSLCATIYRMLTGKVPDEAINRIKNDGLVPVRSLVNKVPKNIESAIGKGLSVMPENRQQTVEELYHELYISRQDLRVEKRNQTYQNINKLLVKLIVFFILAIALLVTAWTKKEKIREFQVRISNAFSSDEADSVGEIEDIPDDSSLLGQADSRQDKKGNNSEETESVMQSETTDTGASTKSTAGSIRYAIVTVEVAKVRNRASTDGEIVDSVVHGEQVTVIDEVQENQGSLWYYVAHTNSNGETKNGYLRADMVSVSSDAETPAIAPAPIADAGTQSYQLMRSGAESASQTDSAVVIVRDGNLNNVAEGYTVGQILDLYSDTVGTWYTYDEQGVSQTYVYYEGQKYRKSFVLEFEVYANDTFKLTGAAQDNVVLEKYSDFFQEILNSLGF